MNDYINKILGFYFDGGFEQMIVDSHLDEEEIAKWGNLAVLFEHCIGDVSGFSEQRKEDAYCLVEALHTKLEVDLMLGEIDKSSLSEVCEGYEFEESEFGNAIERGVQLIEDKGLNLCHLIPEG